MGLDHTPHVGPGPAADSGSPACAAEVSPVVTGSTHLPEEIVLDLDPMETSPLRDFPGLNQGAEVFTVYYAKKPGFGFPSLDTTPDLERDYAKLGAIRADHFKDSFWKLQGENWSPCGEARDHIVACGLTHTSMSVGDMVYDHRNKKLMVVDFNGWAEATPRQPIN